MRKVLKKDLAGQKPQRFLPPMLVFPMTFGRQLLFASLGASTDLGQNGV